MRCEQVREILETGTEGRASVQAHLDTCAECAAYARDWQLLAKGLHELSREEVPSPAVGFTTRVVRRLDASPGSFPYVADFVEHIGRRFVFGALTAAVTLLLFLTLSILGPFHEASDLALAQPEAMVAPTDPLLMADQGDLRDLPLAGAGNHIQGGSE